MSENEIVEILRRDLSEHRFTHSLAVAEMAATLARRHGGDEEKARLAGLVHDCMREVKGEEALRVLRIMEAALRSAELNSFVEFE